MAYNKRQKLQDNIKALEVAFDLAKSGRAATESEREALRKYSGFGGLKFILNPCESESDVMRWNKSDKTYFADARKLYDLLKNNAQDDKEYRSFVQSMRNSVLSSFYTPQPIVDAISGGLKDAGVEVKTFLDPSSGKGTFIDSFRQDHPDLKVTAFEKDLLTGLVLKSLHGDSDIHVAGYETIHEDYKNQFDVAASNIPFGDVNVFDPVYANSGDAAKVQATKTLHNYFFMKTLDEVRDGGLVAFITSQGVMDSTRNKNIRRAMLDKAYLVGAVRLPNNLFVDEAGTEVGSDLILLQKDSHKPADYVEYDPEEMAFVENLSDMEAKNPQSSIENDFEKDEVEWYRKTNPNSYIFASQFFWDGESPYLGEISRGTDPYGKAATVCQWNGTMEELGQALRARVGFFMQHYFKHDLYKEHAPVITVIEEKPIPAQGEGVSVTENMSMSEGQQVVSSPTLSSTGQPSRKKKGEVSNLQMSLFDLWDEQPQAAASQESAKENRMEPRAFAGDVLVYYRNGVIIEDAGQIGTLSKIDRDWMFKPLSLPRDTEDRLRQYVKVRDAYEDLYRTEAENQEEYAQGRADLNASYDEFVRRFGALNERKSMKAILMDACGRDMLCIERAVDGKYVKSDIFEKPVAFAVDEVTHVETAEEALMASLNRTGDVDLAYMSDLCDLTEDELRERLREKIYYNPMVRGYEIAERFLSGNVVEKMDYFEDNYGEKVLAAGEEEVGRSYKALQGVRPRPIPFEELDFNFGERWMPTSYFSEFATEFFGTEIQVEYAPNLDEFVIKCDEYWVDKITSEYAVQGESKNFTGLDLLRHALYDTTPIINKVVGYRENGDPIMGPDHEKMQLAASKIDAIREGFNEWIQGHPAKWKEAVADMYNRKFNCFVRANYDGSHQTFPDLDLKALKEKKGISDIYGSQKDAVWMILQNGGGICDHEVGTGKTLIMCLAAHEMKRLGMCHKPIIIGMKANVNEIAATYQSAYPNDRILYAPTESKDFKDRESFFNRMKNNDWDCIIMSHDQFNRIPQSEEVMRDVMYEEMQALEEALDVYAKQSRGGISGRMMKGLETRKENLAVELANLNYKLRNRADDVVDFKTMGIDHIFVDESQQYKNLPFTTRNNRVAGLGDPKGSQRARNLQYAIRTIQDRTGKDLGATFLSGTTISNSLTELYLLFKYLRPHALDAQDIHSFDAWAAIFARKSRDYEINVAGQIVMKERYRHFIKVPELAAFYNEITDYKTAVDVGLERPKMEVSLVNIQPTEDHQDFSKRLLEFAQSGNGELVFRPELNDSEMQAKMLLVTGMGKKASLSPKLVNPEYHEGDDTKIGFAARNIADYYRRYDEQKGTQFVFCDLSTPKKGEWSAYQELKDRLVNDYGIPEEEIQFIQDHGTERKRKAVIDKMNKGEVRVLIGSTTTLGTGVNAQERAVAVHHLDLPWRPSDMEQRNGRAVRKGNLVARDFADNKVDVLVYAVERSLDSYNFYLLQAKSDFIRQMKTGSLGKREFDQGGEDEENGMPFAEYVAITSGNTDLLERAKLEKRILGLESERKAFYKQQQVVQRKLDDARSQLTYQENILGKLNQDKKALEEVLSFKVDSDVDAFEALRDDSGLLSYTSDGRNVQLQHLTFDLTQDEPLGDYLQKAARQEVNGEADVLHFVEDGFDWPLVMTSQTEYNIKTGVNRWVGNHFAVRGESGILYTYNNGKVSLVSKKLAASYPFMAVARIPELIEAHEAKRDMYAKQIPELERIAGKEWEKAEELKNLKTQMQELDKKINMEMDIKTLQQQGQVTLPEQLPYEIEHHSYGRQPWGLKFAVKDFPFLTREDLNEIGDRYHGDIRSSYGEVRGDFRHQFGAEQAFKDLSKLNAEHRGDLDWLKQAASDIYDPSSVYAVKRLNEMGYDRHGNPLTGEDASRMKVISLGDYSIPEIRDLAHGVKDLHGVATEVAAAALSKVVSEMPDADKVVLVPMPGHKGYGGGAEKLCRLMSDLYDIPYENVLYSSSFESLYVWKKQHPNEPLPDLLFGARMDRINGKIPVLVDNVIDTGHTARAALDAIGGNPVMLVVGSTGKHEAEGDNIDVEVLDKGLELVHENTPEGVGFTGMSRKEFDNLLKLAQRFDDSSNAWKANHELRKYGIDKYTGYPLYMVEHISEKWDFTYEDLDEPVKELMSKGFADNVFTQEELERISPEDMKMFREAYVAAQDPDHIDYGYRRRLMVLYDVIREKLGIGVEQDVVSEAKDISMPRETVASDKGKMTVYAVDTYENDRFGGDLKSRANALLVYDDDATRLQAYGFWDRVISNLEKSDRERLVLVPMQFNQEESTAFLSKAVLAMWKHYQNKSLQEYKSIELRDTLRKVDNRWEFKDDVDPSKLYMLVDINMNDGHRLTQAREAFPENCEVKGLVLTYDPDFSEDYGDHIQVVTSKELEDERKAEYEADKEQTLNGYEAALEAFKGVTHLQPEEALDAQKLLWGSWNAPFAKENIRQKLLDEFDIDWQTGKRARFEYVDNTSAKEGTSHVAEDDNTIRYMKGENYFSVREEGDLYVVDLGTKIDVLFDDMPEWFGKTDHELNGMFEKVTGVDGAVNNRGTFLDRETAERFAVAANEHYEHKLCELEEVASSRHTVQSKLRDALIDRMRKAGISVVTDVKEGQRVLDEANGIGVKAMGSKTESKKALIARSASLLNLDAENQLIIDVFTGKRNHQVLTIERNDGSLFSFEISEGNEIKGGTRHALYRHFGTGEGVILITDILAIPDVLRSGDRKEDGNKTLYSLKRENKELTVVTEKRGKKEMFVTLYSDVTLNEKASLSKSKNTNLIARSNDNEALSDAKVQQNIESTIEDDEKMRYQRNFSSEVDENVLKFGEKHGFLMTNIANVGHYARAMREGDMLSASNAFRGIKEEMGMWYKADHPESTLADFDKEFDSVKDDLFKEFGDLNELRAKKLPQYKDMSDEEINDFANLYMDYTTPMSNRSLTLRHLEEVMAYRHGESYADEWYEVRLRFPQYRNEFTSLVKDLPIRHQEAADALAAYESSMKEKYGEEWKDLMNDDEDIHCVELQNAEYRLNPDEHEGYASIAYNQLVQRYGADYLLAFGHDDKNLIIKDELAAAFLMGVRQEMTDEDRVRVEQTEAFKDWFGDWQQYPDAASKVVDQNGRPMVMYHGTGAENAFSIFDLSKSGKSNTLAGVGFWFTPSEEFAKSWGEEVFYNRDGAHVLPVYLNIRNPKIYRPLTEEQVQEGERVKGELDAVREEISSINKQYENDYYHSVIGYYDLNTFETAKRNGFVVDNDEESERIKEHYRTRSEHGREAMSDGEKVYQLMQREEELSKQYDFYRHPDPYEQFRYDVYTVAGRPQDANIGGMGMALSHPKEVLEQFREQLKAQGYDGIIIEDTKYDRRYAGTETTTQYITFDANQIKSATQNIGRFRTENEDIRYHKVDTYPIFVSNAQLAVERIQQQKATPMQWLNMITKNGGIKAGEDKWMGLSVWLKENTSKTLTKGEVLDFISQNAIKVEEVNYVNPSDYTITKEDILESEAFQSLQDSFIEYDDDENPYVDQERFNQRRHEDNNFFNGFSIDYWGEGIDVDDLRSAALYLGLIDGNRVREINDTRLGYTTEGLEKNREIALTVPSIEPWNLGDSIHFGDAGDGRAVVWVRFGETTVKKDVPYIKEVTEFEEPYTNYRGDEIYVPKGQSRFDMNDMIEKINPEAHYGKEGYYVYVDHAIVGFEPTMERAIEAMNEYYYLHPSVRQETERVLVVDEIQSKRHQDGRKVGYIPQYTEARARAYEAASKAYRAAVDAYREHVSKMDDKYGDFSQFDEGSDPFTPGKRAIDRWRDVLTEDERAEFDRLKKDMNDKQDVALSLEIDGFIDRSKVPDAPFEKNWQELAMKRVLRYAADNGYDRVAWTTGEQQSERYNLGTVLDTIDIDQIWEDGTRDLVVEGKEDGYNYNIRVSPDGIIEADARQGLTSLNGQSVYKVFGQSIGESIMTGQEGDYWQGEDFRIGNDGMRAFYDQMLVNYMNKYGKQWGTQVEDVELSRLGYRGERPVMHSVVVNAAMKDSVLQGQPMFFKARDGRAYGFVKGGVIYIDRAIATAETPLHEYTHLWAEALRQKNPDEWKNVVELMKGATDIWNKVKREYPDLTDDDSIADEVLAQYSGKRGYQKLMDETKGQEDMSVLDKLAEALARFWKAVADFLHIHYTSKEQVADQVLHDLLTGVNPLEYADKMVDQRETESFKEWFGDWQNDAQNASKVVDAEGKPLVVEHATNADFTVFDMSHIGENSKDNGVFGAGFYFGTHAPGWMQGAKNIMKVYLDIKHPFEVTDDVVDIYTEIREKMDTPAMRSLVVKGFNDHEEHLGVLIDQIKYVDDLIKNHPNEVQEMMLKDEELEYVRPDDRLRVWREHEIMNRSGLGSLALSWQSFINHQIGSHEFTAAAIQDGYDGVIVDRGNDYKEYVVFEANQIKSATYNVGTFNLNSNDIRFHFIGEEGARQLDQNLGGNYNSFLEKAKYCENMGYAPHYIKFVTGWEKGIDGKWRYELGGIRDFNPYGNQDWLSRHPEVVRYRELHQRDVAQVMGIDGFQPLSEKERNEMEALAKDSNVRYFDGTATQKNPASLTVKDYMDAPMLFAAYPELRDLPVKVEPLTSNGKYVSEVDALTGDTNRYLVISDALVQSLRDMNASARQQMQDTFIHEIQHYIQEMEGFARGGNLSTVATMRRDEAQAKLDALRPVYEEYQYLDACIDSAEDSEMALQYYDAKDAFEKEHAHELKAYQVALDARHVAELDMVSGYLSDRNFIDYQRLAGEVEARNAVRRSGMSFRERWNSPISSTEDVPREEQIVNYRSSMAASLESPSTRKMTVADREAGGALVEQLEKMGIIVHTDLEENRKKLREFLLDKSDAGKVRYMETEAGQVYGFSYKGEMYLDMRKVDAELPLARYAHLWAASMRRVNPDNWKHVVGMFKSDADTWKALQEAYPQYSNEDDLVEAAIVKYSGKQGAEKMQRQLQNMSTRDADYKSRWGNIFQNVSRAIQDFWKHVGDSFNIRYSSKEELADQILKDFTNSVNPVKKVEKWLQERDKAYAEAVARNDMDTARDLFWEALQENVGNGITPFMAVDGYRGKLDRLAREIKDEGNTEAINKAADLMAPYIRAGMVLVPAPGHEGYATHTLALAHAISERSHVPVADVLVGVERARQYDVKKATGKPILAEQLGIRKMGELPKWYGVERLPVVIDNVVHSGNTAEACVKALGKGVVLSLASAVSQERHVASLKSLAPVVYGKDDQLIPLSKRFELKSKWLGRAVSNLSSADPKIQGLESYSLEDIKELVSAHVNGILEESFSGEDISIKEITVIGSRSRGEAHEGSDLDILVEYEGDGVREDAMFDALNEEPLEIEGIKVDINPINPHYSLSTSQWLERDAKWREQDANNSNQLNNSETMKSKVKQRNASTRDKLSNLLAGLLPNNGDRITVFDKGDSGLNDPRTFKEVGYIAREDGHYNYHQGEDQVDIYELQPEGDVVKKLYSRALAVEISDQLDEGQRFDNMKSLGSRYQGDGSFVRKENGLLYISGRADGEVVTDWLSVRPEVLEALSDEIEDRYDLLAARERLANLVHDAESISFPEPLHMKFPDANFDYPVIALRDTSVFGVHSYYGNEWPFIVEYQTEHGTNQMNPDMTEDMYNVLSDKIEETVSLKQVFTKLLPENADVLEIEQPWVVDQPIGVKDGKEIKVEDVHHAIDVDDGKNVFVAGSERTGYVNVNRLMAWDQQKVLAQAVQALNAKTLKERFDAFINEHHEEPKYAEVTIRFKDDDVRQNVIIQLDHGADPKIDDNIFFYCGGLNDLIGMTDEENAEDFVLVDVEDTIFHSKALFRNDVETLLSDVILRADELGIDYHPIALKGDISMDVLNLDLNEQLEPKTFKYATVTKDNVILSENLADVFDNNKGYSLDDMPTDAQQEVLDRLFDAFFDMKEPMTVVYDEKEVPTFALGAIINDDFTGIDDGEDVDDIANFIEETAGYTYQLVPDSEGFTSRPAFGKPTECQTVFMVKNVTPQELLEQQQPEEDLDSELLEARVKLVDVISQALIDMDGHIELGEQYELDSVPAKGDWKDEGNGHAFMEVIKGEDVTMFYDVHAEKYPLSEIIDKIGYSAVYDLTIAVREAQIAHLIGEDKEISFVNGLPVSQDDQSVEKDYIDMVKFDERGKLNIIGHRLDVDGNRETFEYGNMMYLDGYDDLYAAVKEMRQVEQAESQQQEAVGEMPYKILIGEAPTPDVLGEYHVQFDPGIMRVSFGEQEDMAKEHGGTMRVTNGEEWADFYSRSDAERFAEAVVALDKQREEEAKQAAEARANLSPIVKQFYDLKDKHPDALLLFRSGDFYVAYQEDAKKCADILGITLTTSSKQKGLDGKALKQAGFPYHALDSYLPKLIRKGERVAICDQLELPKQQKVQKNEELKAMIERKNHPLAKGNVPEEYKAYVDSFRKGMDDIPSTKDVLHPNSEQIDLLPKSVQKLYARYEALYEDAYEMRSSRFVAQCDKEEAINQASEALKIFKESLCKALDIKEDTAALDVESEDVGNDKKMQVVETVTPGIAPEATKEVEQTKEEQEDIFDVTPAEYDMVQNAVIEHLEKANKDYYLVDIDIPNMIQSAPLAQSWKELREVAAGTTAILLQDAEIKRPGILERYGTTMKAETAVLAYEAVQYAKDALKNQREGMNEKMDAKVQELNDTLKKYNKIRTWIDSMYPLSHPTQSYSIEKRDLASFALLETNEHGTKYASSFVSSELLMKKMDSLQQLMEKFLNQEITEEQMLSVAKTPEDKEAVKKLFDFIETKQKNQSSQEDHSDNNSINLKSSTIMDPKEKEVQEAAAQKAQEQEVSAQVNDTEGKAKKPGRWEKMDYSKYQLPEGATLVSAFVVPDEEAKSGMRLDAVVDINGEQKDLSAPLYKNNVEDYQQGKVDGMGLAPILLRKQVAEAMGIELPKSEKRFDLEKDKSEKPVENVKKEADYSKYHMADGTTIEKANVYQDKETKEWKVSALVDGKRMTAKLYPNEVHDYFVKGEDGKRLNKVTAEMLIAKKFGVEAEARKEQKRKENETKTKKVEETKQQNAQKKEEEKKKVEEQKKQEKKSDKVAPAVAHSLAIAAALVGAKRGIWLNPAAKPAPTFFKSAAIISGFNALMMGLHSDANKFKSNVYVNFGKAQSEGMSVKKNQESLRYNFKNWNNYENMYDKNDVITREDYEKLPEEERELYKVKVANEARPVFNIDQTTMSSVKQEEYASLVPAPAKVMTVAEQLESLVNANPNKVLIIKAESEDKFVIMGDKVADVANALSVLPTKDYDGEKPYIVLAPEAVEAAVQTLNEKGKNVEVVKELDDPELVERFPDASAIALKGEQMMESIKQQGGKVAVLPFDVDGTAYDAKQDVLQVVEAKTPVVGGERTQALDRVADIYRAAVAYTGASERLNRVTDSDIPENAVRQEKLVQELAAGVMMADAGLPAKLSKENEALVPYWERELKENPKLVDIIERDVNNAVKVLKGIQNGEQVDYSQMRGKPRTEEAKLVSRTIAREISALPSAADKTMVIVRDLEAKKAVVLLPAGASSEVNNEIPGLNKKRIAIALKKEGYEDVQFYNAGGELGFKESNGYFKGKEVIEAKLNQYKVEPINRLNISELLKRDDYVEVKELKYTTLNDNRPAFYVRPVDERIKSFVVPATDADLTKFWRAIKGKDSAAINEMRRELGQELYVRVTEHPELKRDVTPAINQELDITRITYANLKKEAQDAGKKDIFKMTAVIDGKRVSKEIERPVYDKLFMVEDKKAFSLALATHVFAEELGIKAGQDVSFREGGQAQVGDHNDAEVQEEQKAAEAPEKTQESRGGFHR